MLRKFGLQLDSDIYPTVKNGGILAPGEPTDQNDLPGEKEFKNEKCKQRRPETGPRAGATRGQGPTGAPGPAPQIISSDLQVIYEGELGAVREAYPNTRIWRQPEGLWILSESTPLPDYAQKALFLTGIPFERTRLVRSWGFWVGIPLRHPVWIGPRHTNFPDGSVCAFAPSDKVWSLGDSIVRLLDLYTTWAFRHLHLQILGRWPGKQVAKIPYERMSELREDEFCGCDRYDKLYGDCCLPKDRTRNFLEEYLHYLKMTGGIRRPPESVVNFVIYQKNIPKIVDCCMNLKLF